MVVLHRNYRCLGLRQLQEPTLIPVRLLHPSTFTTPSFFTSDSIKKFFFYFLCLTLHQYSDKIKWIIYIRYWGQNFIQRLWGLVYYVHTWLSRATGCKSAVFLHTGDFLMGIFLLKSSFSWCDFLWRLMHILKHHSNIVELLPPVFTLHILSLAFLNYCKKFVLQFKLFCLYYHRI